MLDERSFPVDPQILSYKLEMAVLDSLLDKSGKGMADEFDYFSMIGRGGSPHTPDNHYHSQESSQTSVQLHSDVMSLKGKEPLSRVRSHPKTKAKRVGSNHLEPDRDIRPRTNSMPSKEQLLRVRNFQTSSRGLENQGDTVVKTSSHSSLVSNHSSDGAAQSDREDSPILSGVGSTTASQTHRILLLGGERVGKTALTQQFLTSDDITADDYLDDGEEKYCTVQVDGEESFLIFMDSDYDKNNYDPSSATAYIVVYSCTDRSSFIEAQGLLKNLRHFEKNKAIILCGNKSDLVRKRQVSTEEGKQLALEYEANFIETSTMLNHKVDNLLVGIVSQIRERSKPPRKSSKKSQHKGSDFRKSVKGLVGKLGLSGSSKTKKQTSS